MDESGITPAQPRAVPARLPGAEIVSEGLADLGAGRDTPNSDAVAMASIRLRAAGIDVPADGRSGLPSHRLYEKLARRDSRTAHSRYNAIVRRMVSFARALEHSRSG